VLDNIESVLKEGSRAGQYREGYEEYGKLIQRVGEANHQSCFLLTSREKPKGDCTVGRKNFTCTNIAAFWYRTNGSTRASSR